MVESQEVEEAELPVRKVARLQQGGASTSQQQPTAGQSGDQPDSEAEKAEEGAAEEDYGLNDGDNDIDYGNEIE